MAKRQTRKTPEMPARPPSDAIDTEQKARQESEIEEGHEAGNERRRFWETDEEHQARLRGEPGSSEELSEAPISDATDHMGESERHGDPERHE